MTVMMEPTKQTVTTPPNAHLGLVPRFAK